MSDIKLSSNGAGDPEYLGETSNVNIREHVLATTPIHPNSSGFGWTKLIDPLPIILFVGNML